MELFYYKQKIFSFLNLNLKLDLIKYNKNIQHKFQIDINYYKKISGKYIKGKRNGKGKEFTLDKKYLIFEGEYLNGKRNGKGKEYYNNGNLKFEGEYLKGKKLRGKEYNENGKLISRIDIEKGEQYYSNGNIRFKGQCINGKIWKGFIFGIDGNKEYEVIYGKKNGKGKEYNYDGKLIFEGEYLNGERNGKGYEYNYNGKLIFEGEYLNNNRCNGKGRDYYNDWSLKF